MRTEPSILEVLWDSLLSPHALKQLCQFFCHWKSTSFIDVMQHIVSVESRLCFFIVIYLDLSVDREDSLTS